MAWSDLRQLLTKIDHELIVEVSRDRLIRSETGELSPQGLQDLWMVDAKRLGRGPGIEVEEDVSIDIFDERTLAVLEDEREVPPVRLRNDLLVSGDDLPRSRPGRFDSYNRLRIFHAEADGSGKLSHKSLRLL